MKLIEKSEKHTGTTEGDWYLIPTPQGMESNDFEASFDIIIDGGGSARIETTSASEAEVKKVIAGGSSDYVKGMPWDYKDVTEDTPGSLDVPVTAFRFISTGGTKTMFNARIER